MQDHKNSDNSLVEVCASPLSLQALVALVEDDGAGAVATFSGNTRNTFQGREVVKLEYEAYQPMARKKLQESIHYTCFLMQFVYGSAALLRS